MSSNKYRGEITLNVNGEPTLFRMNFYAISFLETKTQTASLPILIAKFSDQTYTAQDIVSVLEAGYLGANKKLMNLSDAEIDGGVRAAAYAAVMLLKLAFEGFEV